MNDELNKLLDKYRVNLLRLGETSGCIDPAASLYADNAKKARKEIIAICQSQCGKAIEHIKEDE